jgi:hypothetical protein
VGNVSPSRSRVENFNGVVNELVEAGRLNRVLAQTEITFPNSMIESWWSAHKQRDYLVTEFVE